MTQAHEPIQRPNMAHPEQDSAETKVCPFCAETIKAEAKKCKHCGEILDEDMRKEKHQTEAHLDRKWNPGIAAVLSLVIPGAGQMYKGQIGNGLVWLIVVVAGYMFLFLPGLILHICCIVGAASVTKPKPKPKKVTKHL